MPNLKEHKQNRSQAKAKSTFEESADSDEYSQQVDFLLSLSSDIVQQWMAIAMQAKSGQIAPDLIRDVLCVANAMVHLGINLNTHIGRTDLKSGRSEWVTQVLNFIDFHIKTSPEEKPGQIKKSAKS